MANTINCVILCGGSGTRLWPLSREKLPKQLLTLVNSNSMLQNTIIRLEKLISYGIHINQFIFVCNEDHSFIIEQQLHELPLFSGKNPMKYVIIKEPVGRDTAPAVCISTLYGDVDHLSLVVPSDHVFNDDTFIELVSNKITEYADSMSLFGIRPTHPSSAYGYIETAGVTHNNKVISFVEKPDMEKATYYMTTGRHLWNAGVFLFRNKVILKCYQKHANSILDWCKKTLEHSPEVNHMISLSKEHFLSCQAISVDYAIMENICKEASGDIDNVAMYVYPYSDTWCDIGSFNALHEYLLATYPSPNRINSNVFEGAVVNKNSSECYVHTKKLTAVIGLKNMIIVDTPDALLVCDKSQTENIKSVVNELKKHHREETMYHTKVYRPWGWYINIDGNDHSGTKIKRLMVLPGKRLSLQSHEKREEHWVVVNGTACVELDGKEIILEKNGYVHIPIGARHRIHNKGTELVEIVETQVGIYLGENDIVRYEDDFGRA